MAAREGEGGEDRGSSSSRSRSERDIAKMRAAIVVGAGQELREVLSAWKRETGYHRALGLGLNNLTGTMLATPQWWLESGRVDKAPADRFAPNEASASLWTKKGGAARGSVGVLTYDIESANCSIAVMWSVPYSYMLYDNWFNVKIVDRGTPVDWSLFHTLYTQSPTKASAGILVRVERGFKITAEMENKKVASLIISIQQTSD